MLQNCQRGDVVEVDLGNPPKEIKGHEQGYKRPCIVLKSFTSLKIAIIIPCSTKEQKYSLYTIVKILKGVGGLISDSYALCHQIRTVSFDRILNKRGHLAQNDMLKISSVVADMLEL